MKMKNVVLFLCCIMGVMCSCSEEEDFAFPAGSKLTFSADTVSFDTVFTSIGSATKQFRVYNNSDKGVRLTSVGLSSGGSSGFRVNVDGQYGTQFSDVEINGDDSIFVFVEVTVDPHDSDYPILLADSLVFCLPDGSRQNVILQAYGQDIIIMKGEHISHDTHLSAQRPYLIYDSLVVDSGILLTIDPGVTLCFHSGASLEVHGTVQARGSLEHPVVFRGDRTDRILPYLPYDLLDAQWGGIHIDNKTEDRQNIFSFCDIHGGTYGIRLDQAASSDSQTLCIESSSIHNVSGHGLDLRYSLAYVANCQISNAGSNCVNVIGGKAQFYYTTIAQFYPWSACGHAVYFANIADSVVYPLHELLFQNCIITGYDTKDEFYGTKYTPEEGSSEQKAVDFNYSVKNSLVLTVPEDVDTTLFTGCIWDTDTAYNRKHNFKLIDEENYVYDFHLSDSSKARGIGAQIRDLTTDKDGKPRPVTATDAGCFQFAD